MNASVILFSPDGETVCTVLYFGSPEAEAMYEEDLTNIIASLKP